MTSKAVLSTMADRIVGRFYPSRVVLFGSHDRGTADGPSDVDLLVVMREVPDKRLAAVEIRRSLGDLPFSKDIVVTTPDEIRRQGTVIGTVLHAALRERVTVYEGPRSRGSCGGEINPRVNSGGISISRCA